MKLKEKISIENFNGKSFKVRLNEAADNKQAVITHYLHNLDNEVAKLFEEDAIKYVKQYVKDKYDSEKNLKLFEESVLNELSKEVNNLPFPTPKNYTFKFIDLFAGIGGFRLAMQNLGEKSIFTSEWDKEAQKTYRANFGEVPFGDITKEQTKKFIPDGFETLDVPLSGRAFRSNLFVRSSQKGFPLHYLTQIAA